MYTVPDSLNVMLNYEQRFEMFYSGHKNKTLSTKPQMTFELDSPLKLGESWQEQYKTVSAQAKNTNVVNLMEVADRQIRNLNREINVLKEEKMRLSDVVTAIKDKVFVCFCFFFLFFFFFFCICFIIIIL
jgi:hypothetical protein